MRLQRTSRPSLGDIRLFGLPTVAVSQHLVPAVSTTDGQSTLVPREAGNSSLPGDLAKLQTTPTEASTPRGPCSVSDSSPLFLGIQSKIPNGSLKHGRPNPSMYWAFFLTPCRVARENQNQTVLLCVRPVSHSPRALGITHSSSGEDKSALSTSAGHRPLVEKDRYCIQLRYAGHSSCDSIRDMTHVLGGTVRKCILRMV